MSDDIFDFGFTAVDEDELQAVQNVKAEATQVASTAEATQERLDELYNAVMPLLTNLKKNPEKEFILWPNRIDKIEQFEAKLLDIYRGS
jgi:hypothetical protein